MTDRVSINLSLVLSARPKRHGPEIRKAAGLCLLALFAASCTNSGTHSGTHSGTSEAPSDLGATVFAENCAVCHTLPILSSLFEQNRGRPPGFVYDAITEGNMRRMGAPLDEKSRRAVAEFFTGVPFGSPASVRNFEVSPPCEGMRSEFDWSDLAYPSWGGSRSNLRSIAREEGLSREQVARLEVAWVIAFPESSQLRSQPTAAGGALFVGSHNGSVYALDQATGCTRWRFKAATEVRSAVTIDVSGASSTPVARALFADRAANVYALDAETGALLWNQSADPHANAAVTGSISAFEGRLFVPISSNDDINSLDPSQACCTHRGSVVALDAKSGEILWRTPTIAEPPVMTGRTVTGAEMWGPSGASVWNTPTLDVEAGLLFVGAGNNHSRPASGMSDSVIAMELRTGRVVWTYQAQSGDAWNASCLFGNRTSCPDPEGPDTDFGATTMLVEIEGRKSLLAGQKSGLLHALDPATGQLLWKTRVAAGGAEGGIRYGMATRDGVIYVPSADPPVASGGDTADGRSWEPGVFALSAKDGTPIWSTSGADLCFEEASCDGAVAAPPLATEDVLIAAGREGVLYALDRKSGEPVWSFDTAREFATLVGASTRGGGIAGTAGPMVANGRLFVSSGYGQAQRPGNALLAFAPRVSRDD